MTKQILNLVCLLVVLAATAAAQTSSGTINGTVLDQSGASVAGAKVRLLGTETGDMVRELVSANDGGFVAPLLRPSTYTVEVTAAGFKTLTRSGIVLRVDDALNLRLTLEVGSTTDSVTVSASAEL